MNPTTATVLSFAVCLAAFTVVGALSMRSSSSTTDDYLVAGRDVPPWLAALSAAATNNSGFMFIGLIGFAWTSGVQAIWLHGGWVMGDLMLWMWVHRRLNRRAHEVNALSVPALLSTNRGGDLSRPLAIVTGLLTLLFLGGYAAAQLKAGSTTTWALLGWDIRVGAIVGAAIVFVYSMAGGLRASIWTDAAQSFVMVFAMIAMLYMAVDRAGSPVDLFEQLRAIDPALVNWTPEDLRFGLGLYVVGWIFGGLGVLGQPHILIRTMTLSAPSMVPRAARVYFAWYLPFSVAAVLIGLYARVILPELDQLTFTGGMVDPVELALPMMSQELLPPVLSGITLAAVFAATMSTADSQIISCSAALTQDIAPRWKGNYTIAKIATACVTIVALCIALYAREGVFSLVLLAWSILGSAFGPILVVRLFGGRLSDVTAFAMMIVGVTVVMLWGSSTYAGSIYRLMPGMLSAFATWAIVQPIVSARERAADAEH